MRDLLFPLLKNSKSGVDDDRGHHFRSGSLLTNYTHTVPQGKCTPGLFKVEFKGDKMIGLCSKSYCMESFTTDTTPGQVKFSMKGINKGQFKNPMAHYEQVLTSMENFRACNSGIRSKDQTMATYKQYKNALTYFYLKRKVLEDGCSTVPLDI